MARRSISFMVISLAACLAIQGCANRPLFGDASSREALIKDQAALIGGSISSGGIGSEETRQAQHYWYTLNSTYDRFGRSFDSYEEHCTSAGYNFQRVDYSRPETVQYGCLTGRTIQDSRDIMFVLWASPRIQGGSRQYHYFVSYASNGIRPARFYEHALWYGRYNRTETGRADYEKDRPRPWIPTQLIEPH